MVSPSMREWVSDPSLDLAKQPTQQDHSAGEVTDALRADAPTPEPSEDDAIFEVAMQRQSFEHQRIVSTARHKLFGRGQPLCIGRYEIERRIGAGGMGEVYLARDAELDRKVAIKRVLGRLGGTSHQARLRSEARALARLSHPNVVQVYEFGEHEGRTFVAMEYVHGQTLGSWLSEGQGSWRSVLDKFLAAGRGLAAVHAAGLVHRDFKPDNVLLSDEGRVLVADFGLVLSGEDRRPELGEAPSLGADMRTSVSGAVLGTIRFMALEQLCASKVDARSDQFAFCVALYEALWAKPPFSLESSLARFDELEQGEPRVPSSREGLRPPARLWRVIRRGLSREPEARWPDMDALLEALERETRRRRQLAWVASLSAAATLAIAGVVLTSSPEPDPCAAVERELEDVWDSERRAELERGIAGLDVEHAADSRERVLAGLDRWSSGWVHERERVCRASHEQRLEPELARLQGVCLTRQRQRVEDLVALLIQPELDGDALAGAVEAVADLPDAAACESELALLGVEPPPDAIADQVEALRRDIARAHELRLLGRVDEGLALAEASEQAARELGYGPLLAEALAELARLDFDAGSITRGAERMQSAIDAAEIHRHEALSASLWLELAMQSLAESNDTNPGAWQLGRAEVANARIGASTRASARLAFAHGQLAELQGNDALAEQRYRAAITEAELDETAHRDLPSYLSNLARLVGEVDPHESEILFRTALEDAEALYGAWHPQVGSHLYNLAIALRESDPGNDEIVELLERAIEIWSKSPEHPQGVLAKAEFLLGMQALHRQEFDIAEKHARAAATIQAKALPPQHVDIGETANLLAVIHSVRGEYERALEQFSTALAIWEPVWGLTDPRVQRTRADLAATQVALGKLDEAAAGLAQMLPFVAGQPEQVSVRLQLCEIALRQNDLESANVDLHALDDQDLGDQEFTYFFLRALIDQRNANLQPATRERLRQARTTTRFTAEQITSWIDQLDLSLAERAALQAD